MKTRVLIIILCLAYSSLYAQRNEHTEGILKNGWYELNLSGSGIMKTLKKTGERYSLNANPIVTPKNFKSFKAFENYEGVEGLAIYFDKVGTKEWRRATKKAIDSYLVFILNNEIFCAQQVNSEITGGVSAFWKNQQTEREWKELKQLLN